MQVGVVAKPGISQSNMYMRGFALSARPLRALTSLRTCRRVASAADGGV